MDTPGAAPRPRTTFGRDLGRNATQIWQLGDSDGYGRRFPNGWSNGS